jgi:hypothetical protein
MNHQRYQKWPQEEKLTPQSSSFDIIRLTNHELAECPISVGEKNYHEELVQKNLPVEKINSKP